MRKLFLSLIFTIFTPLTLIVSLFGLFQVRGGGAKNLVTIESGAVLGVQKPLELYSSLPPGTYSVTEVIEAGDARPLIVQNYLEAYDSPIKPYPQMAQLIVNTADKYGLDWRLLIAIAQQESNLGKKIPEDSFNAWGWGIHSRGTLKFSSWEEGIEVVTRGLKEDYFDKGYHTPEEIMAKYTPLSNGSWAFGVNQFLAEME